MKNYKILLIALGLIVALNPTSAQEDTTTHEPMAYHTNNMQYLKFSFMNIFEPEPSVQFGYSFPLKRGSMQLTQELGYCFTPDIIWKGMLNPDRGSVSIHGLRYRANIRAYTGTKDSKSAYKSYVALDAMVKYSDIYAEDARVRRFDGAFTQLMDLEFNKQVFAFHFNLGYEYNLFGRDDLMLDMYAGIGYRLKKLGLDKIPEDIKDDFISPLWYDFLPQYSMPSIMFGAKICFGW